MVIQNRFFEPLFFSKTAQLIWWVSFVFFGIVAILNSGIIALDDYSCIISRIIPAQNIQYSNLIANSGIRHPLATLLLAFFSKLILGLGIKSPLNQLRVVMGSIGAFNIFIFSYFGTQFFKGSQISKIKEWTLMFMGFYFLNPLFLTRPMIETLSSPFLFLSCFYACRYWMENKRYNLVLAIMWGTLSSMIRFQTGVCILTLFICLGIKRDLLGFVITFMALIIFFCLSGILEYYISGNFHGSLKAYIHYNIHYSSGYGTTPFYTFFILMVGLTIPPTFFSRFQRFDWKKNYQPLLPVIAYVGFFILTHSLVPHKEERFMIPIIPLFLILLVPLFVYLANDKRQSWRLIWFGFVNVVLLLLTSFNTPQSNVIHLVKYLGDKSQINTVLTVNESIVLYPTAYILKPPQIKTVSVEEIEKLTGLECSVVVAVREDYNGELKKFPTFHKKIAEFKPGILEQWLVKLNPEQNRRRGMISLYSDPKC